MTRPAGSTAVMAGRGVPEVRGTAAAALNFFPTPPWATRALVREFLLPRGMIARHQAVWEPAAGAGHMSVPLRESFAALYATDVHQWGGAQRLRDFTASSAEDAPVPVEWVITNPPFKLGERFLDRALSIARVGVALLLRLQWLEGEERYNLIFADRKPTLFCPFAERVPMIEGVWDPEADTATAYAWFVWLVGDRPAFIRTEHFPPVMERRHTVLSDLALATPGEARRRREAKAALHPVETPLFEGR